MACSPGTPASCIVGAAGDALGSAASGVLDNAFADAMKDGATWVIRTTIGWWINVPGIDLANSPAATIRGFVMWLAVVTAVVGVTWQGVLMAVTHRASPALEVGRGLLYVAVGIVGPAAAVRAGDSFSTWVLDRAAGGQASDRLIELASLAPIQSAGAVIVLGLCMMIAGLLQAILMMFREGSLVILSGVVVLAAAGTFTKSTRPWLPKVLGWMLALICYKPAAALVYASALVLVGEGDDPRTVVVGLTMMILAIFALPVLMKLFTWTTGAVTSGGAGGMAAMVGASAAAIHASVALQSIPHQGAAAQAQHIRADLGPSSPPPPGGTTPPGGGNPYRSPAGPPPPTGPVPAAAPGAAAPGVGVAVIAAQSAATGARSATAKAGSAMTEGQSG